VRRQHPGRAVGEFIGGHGGGFRAAGLPHSGRGQRVRRRVRRPSCRPRPKRLMPSRPSPRAAYKWGFATDIEMDAGAEGVERGHRPLHLGARRTSRSGCWTGG
jgi:hypothetical protein